MSYLLLLWGCQRKNFENHMSKKKRESLVLVFSFASLSSSWDLVRTDHISVITCHLLNKSCHHSHISTCRLQGRWMEPSTLWSLDGQCTTWATAKINGAKLISHGTSKSLRHLWTQHNNSAAFLVSLLMLSNWFIYWSIHLLSFGSNIWTPDWAFCFWDFPVCLGLLSIHRQCLGHCKWIVFKTP